MPAAAFFSQLLASLTFINTLRRIVVNKLQQYGKNESKKSC